MPDDNMSFWEFLTWLWEGIKNVIAWFGDRFSEFLDTVSNFWTYLSNITTSLWNSVVAWVQTASDNIAAWVNGLIAGVNQAITDVYTWIGTAIKNSQDFIAGVINGAIEGVKTWVTGLWTGLSSWFTQAIADVKAWFTGVADGIAAALNGLGDEVNKRIPFIDSLMTLLSGGYWDILKNLITGLYNNLSAFAKDPIGFLLGVLWNVFLQFLEYLLGYALGAVDSQLPPLPVWGNSGSGGTIPDLPPGLEGQLIKPVTPLWVSGNTYNNPAGHYGADFGLTNGQEVYASHSGVVLVAEWSNVGYGFNVVIANDRLWSRYAHLKAFRVTAGQTVVAGQVIGSGDTTGNSTGNHLHFELKVGGKFVDPVAVFK